MKEKIYCMVCKRRLHKGILGYGGDTIVEYQEGFKCYKCDQKR